MCSRKDYVAIAKMIKCQRENALDGHSTLECLDSLAEQAASYFAKDNHAFDHARFMAACQTGYMK